MGFFQQGLQLIVQPYFVTPELVLCARHGPPETLFAIRHEAQGQLLRHQPLQQTFGIAKVSLASPAAHDWTRLAPDGVCPTSGPHLPASHGLASSTSPSLPKPVSSIARWIPLLLPRPAAR